MREEKIRNALEEFDGHWTELVRYFRAKGIPCKESHGVCKICLIFEGESFVVKMDKSSNKPNAELELRTYQDAVREGVAQVFPKTEFFCRTRSGCSCFKQEKVNFCSDNLSYSKRRKWGRNCNVKGKAIRTMNREFYNSPDDDLWLKRIYQIYGKAFAIRLEKFTREHKINDLHCGNTGFIKNHPVFIDFSGYYY